LAEAILVRPPLIDLPKRANGVEKFPIAGIVGGISVGSRKPHDAGLVHDKYAGHLKAVSRQFTLCDTGEHGLETMNYGWQPEQLRQRSAMTPEGVPRLSRARR